MSSNATAVLHPSAQTSPDRDKTGIKELLREMDVKWSCGEEILAEVLLARCPDLAETDAIDLVCEEVYLRQERGQVIDRDALIARFPQWRAQIEVLLACNQLLQPSSARKAPAVGESLNEHFLVAELGRGAMGSVFLATQPSLADRPLVLKITPRDGQEHVTLARLQHTNIMPLYAVEEDSVRDCRILCMPYLGGLTLERFLRDVRDIPIDRRHGRHLAEALSRSEAESPIVLSGEKPARKFFEQSAYVDAMCWLGIGIADGLEYAHQRRLVHLDVKPSNILIAADGQPMLLDFHLTREPVSANEPVPAWFGGTPRYMSPEQRQTMTALEQGLPVPVAVEYRSDVYSLGLLLHEMLGGTITNHGAVSPLQSSKSVPLSLRALVAKCLAADPQARYRSAAGVASDLRRHLANLPLQGVGTASLVERWQKFRRRRPTFVTSTLLVLLLLATIIGAAFFGVNHARQARRQGEQMLADGRSQLSKHHFSDADDTFRLGQQIIAGQLFCEDLVEQFHSERERTRRALAARELHRVADQMRFLTVDPDAPSSTLNSLLQSSEQLWKGRDQILDAHGRSLDVAWEERMRIDLLDLLILNLEVRERLAAADELPALHRQALTILDDAEKTLGASPMLAMARDYHRGLLGPKYSVVGRSMTDRLSMGRFHLHRSNLREAAEHLEAALRKEPDSLWINYYLGWCRLRSDQPSEAVRWFSVCIALAPSQPECWLNRSVALSRLGDTEGALNDCDRALEVDAGSYRALLLRAGLWLAKKDTQRARQDLEAAQALHAPSALVHLQLAKVCLAEQNKKAARRHLQQVLLDEPKNPQAVSLMANVAGTDR